MVTQFSDIHNGRDGFRSFSVFFKLYSIFVIDSD